MVNTLRTRIAAAIRAVDDMRVCKLSDADIKFITDAVIRELGLKRVNRYAERKQFHRYETDWAVSDECCKGGPQWGHDWNCPTLP